MGAVVLHVLPKASPRDERSVVLHVYFAGSVQSNGSVVLWRMIQRNAFGGSNKNDRVEESLVTSSPHKGSVTCITHTPLSSSDILGGPLVFSGSTDHTVKVSHVPSTLLSYHDIVAIFSTRTLLLLSAMQIV